MKATHKHHKQMVGFQMVDLQPGQFVFGRKKAAQELGMSEQNIRTCIDHLRRLENITIQSTNKYSVITIINWEAYQQDQPAGQPSNQPTSNQQLTTNKNEKNERKKNKSTSTGYTNEFEKFWSSYPKKVGKGAAFKTWKSLNGTRPEVDEIVRVIEKQKQSEQWKKQGGQFIPNPQTWLNQERWLDELSNAQQENNLNELVF